MIQSLTHEVMIQNGKFIGIMLKGLSTVKKKSLQNVDEKASPGLRVKRSRCQLPAGVSAACAR